MTIKAWARISNGVVAEALIKLPDTLNPTSLFGTTSTFVDVTSFDPQPVANDVATLAGAVWTFTAPPASEPSPLQVKDAAVVAALAAGCPVVSTGTPALSATYPIDEGTLNWINRVCTYINAYGGFPAGQATLSWPDTGGALHAFSSPSEFLTFAKAIADWVAKIDLFAVGTNGSLPSGSETIA